MTAEPERIRSPDGALSLHTRTWPAAAPRAVLLLVHGLGEHCGRYDRLAGELAGQGITTFGYDQRGHGRSGGRRGHVLRFAELLDDLDAAAERARGVAGGLPLFLMGHSFGGLVALRWLQTRSPALAGAVVSAPLLEVALQPPRWKVAVSGVLSRWAPALSFRNEIDPSALSRVEAYVRSYREDPLVHDRITPRMYTEMLDAAATAAREPLPTIPLCFLVPGSDTICAPGATLRLAERSGVQATVRHYPEARHESFNDLERTAVVADLAGWLHRYC